MESYDQWKTENPDTAVVTDFFINLAMTAAELVGLGPA